MSRPSIALGAGWGGVKFLVTDAVSITRVLLTKFWRGLIGES